jgi:hypothetical protein
LVSSWLAGFPIADCSAGIGLGEWTIETPGKNFIADSDLFPDQGVCLHRPAEANGALGDHAVCVAHIEWWMYFQDHVVGKAKKGFFVFDERSRKVETFENQASFDAGMKKRELAKPLSKRLTPQDGWNLGVGMVLIGMYQKQLKDLKEGGGIAKDLGPAERQSQAKLLAGMLEQLQAQVAKTTDDPDGGPEAAADGGKPQADKTPTSARAE